MSSFDESRRFADLLPQIIWAVGADGQMHWMNRGFLDFTGRNEEGYGPHVWAEVLHPNEVESVLTTWRSGSALGEAFEFTYRLRRSDGRYIWFLAHASPQRDEAGRIVRWYGVSTDIDGRLREGEELRLLADTIPQFVYMVRADGSVEYANEQLRAYSGIDPTQASFAWSDLIYPLDLEGTADFWATVLADTGSAEIELRFRRSDGVYRWFLTRFRPRRDESGQITSLYATATDIHDRKRSADALAYLVEVGEVLSGSRDVGSAIERAAGLAVPRVADWCAIYLRESSGFFRPAAIHHIDASKVAVATELVRMYPFSVAASEHMMRTKQPTFLSAISPDELRAGATDARHADMLSQLDIASAIVVPLVVADDVIGMLHLVRGEANDRFTGSDVDFAVVLAKRIALTLHDAMLFEREHNVARAFQNAALPNRLPSIPGLDLDAVYDAGERDSEIGGDWYDALQLKDGSSLFSIGDVSGKGLSAAVLMGSIRQAIRVAALQGLEPSEILRVADAALEAEQPGRFVTAFVAKLAKDRKTISYSTAGHPPPILRDASGTRPLRIGDLPLGVDDASYVLHRQELETPWLLVAYTDGLIERTGRPLDGERTVIDVVSHEGIVHARHPARYVRARALGATIRDDTAILTIRADAGLHWRFGADDALQAEPTRRQVHQWLEEHFVGDIAGAELVFGELIGNVVRHVPGSIDVDIVSGTTGVHVYVQDSGTRVSLRGSLPIDPLSENGRGLFLIQSFGRGLTSVPLPVHGNQVSVELDLKLRRTSS